MGRERALSAAPSADVAAVESALALTTEARLALGGEGAPPLDGIPDIRPFFDSDIRWLKHFGFAPLDIPTLDGGLSR